MCFFRSLFSVLLAVVVLMGCDVHQWPESIGGIEPDPAPTPLPDLPKVAVPMRMAYATDFYVWEHRYDPVQGKVEAVDPSADVFPDYPGASSRYDGVVPAGLVLVRLKAFSAANPSLCVADTSFTRGIEGTYDTDFEMALPESGTYDVVAWSQLLAPAQTAPYYDASSFSQIHIIADNYQGNTDYRDGFCGRIRIDAATEANGRYVVRMKRPMGKFELVTTDLSEFLDRETIARKLTTRAVPEDYRVVISFPGYYPSSYSAMDDYLENSSSGVAFATQMTVTGVGMASLGFDYVMLNNILSGGVQARVDVYRLDGTRVAGSKTIDIPMRRDYHTLLRGAFLSMEGSGGVGIDPGFNGDHNITWQ